jgi:formylglycine-generating enzyme required for sulfatase activity
MTGRVRLCFLVLSLLAIALFVFSIVWWSIPPEPEIDMKLVLIPAGKFLMGSPKEEKDHEPAEEPQHEVQVQAFYLGAYEVTQGQYRLLMGNNPSFFSRTGKASEELQAFNTDDFPVEQVSWHEAQEFCKRLSALSKERKAGRVYRLPTEAEWEYACRAGTTTPFYTGETLTTDQANFTTFDFDLTQPGGVRGFRLERTATVGSYPPNPWGLYDMQGNVKEWCQDSWMVNYSKDGRPVSWFRDNRVVRGGGLDSELWACRSAKRGPGRPDARHYSTGFRVACSIPTPAPEK